MKTKTNYSRNAATMDRRSFLRVTGGLSLGAVFMPGIVIAEGEKAPTANGKLNIAGIGIGGQGMHDLGSMASENVVALCDADEQRAGNAKGQFPAAKVYTDYRKMLDEMKEIDAVVIATPDHHHAPASIEAIARGKHVYCEKPLTHSVWEARQVANAAKKAGIATQMGNQGQASRETRSLCEVVWSGVLGGITEAHIWTDRPSKGLHEVYWPQGMDRPGDKPPVPPQLNWDLWLGPAAERPYHPAYTPFIWRGWLDFGTGALGDIGCHAMDPVFRALKLGAPSRVQGSSTRVNAESFPLGSLVTWEYPARSAERQSINTHIKGLSGAKAGEIAMPECKVVWYDGGLRPPRPAGLPPGTLMGDNGRLLVGEKGFLLGGRLFLKESQGSEPQNIESHLAESPGHYQEWIQACKGGAPAGSNFDWAGPLAEAVLLGNVTLRPELREDLTLAWLAWDSANLQFTNLTEANKFLRSEYRPGWRASL